jgi:hypothetical protein
LQHYRIAIVLLCLGGVPAGPAASEQARLSSQPASGQPQFAVTRTPPWLQGLVQRIALENIPRQYQDTRQWGRTARRFDGLDIDREGFGWKAKPRFRQVKHGTWFRYQITQIDPVQNLRVGIDNWRDAGRGRLAFEVSMATRLRATGRVSRWRKGVQIFSVSADVTSDADLALACELSLHVDMTRVPPDVILKPRVARADLGLSDLRVHSISKLRGPLAQELGDQFQRLVTRRLRQDRERIVNGINRQLAREQDWLRFSLSDFARRHWNAWRRSATEDPGAVCPPADIL